MSTTLTLMASRLYGGKLTTQGNFYPIPSYMFLQDTTSRVTLLSGQPLGVSSRETGVFEVVLDHRLSMDDNRGLGHGVMDNKVTLSSFRLLVEHRSSADSNPTRQVAYPSLMAHYTSSILTLPIHPFIMKTSSSHQLAASYTGLKGQLPCDIHMLNLRSVVTSSSKEAAMLLHRKGFDCGFSAALLTCHLSSGQVSARTMFTKEPSSSQRMSLTMMYPSDTAPDHIDPMEIATHKLSWS
ncbi:alpha-mannosidase 2-like isoform X1 [Dysidea avara]|uniref:alpha-mannosidase 2-like isoform X1 n=1 Tax=Dysidea avara TaxID=196820 RepID=UPI00331832B9